MVKVDKEKVEVEALLEVINKKSEIVTAKQKDAKEKSEQLAIENIEIAKNEKESQ